MHVLVQPQREDVIGSFAEIVDDTVNGRFAENEKIIEAVGAFGASLLHRLAECPFGKNGHAVGVTMYVLEHPPLIAHGVILLPSTGPGNTIPVERGRVVENRRRDRHHGEAVFDSPRHVLHFVAPDKQLHVGCTHRFHHVGMDKRTVKKRGHAVDQVVLRHVAHRAVAAVWAVYVEGQLTVVFGAYRHRVFDARP